MRDGELTYPQQVEMMGHLNAWKARALAAEALLNAARDREAAWLIEWPASRQMPVRYWHPTEGHVLDANDAVRFCRREDAEAMLKRDHLFGGAKAVEHIWTALLSTATSPGEGSSSANRAARIASDHAASETLRKSGEG